MLGEWFVSKYALRWVGRDVRWFAKEWMIRLERAKTTPAAPQSKPRPKGNAASARRPGRRCMPANASNGFEYVPGCSA
jgi:hypothetical protein